MSTIELDHRKALRLILSILAALLVLAATHSALWAGTSHTFVLPASDAYGASDCIGKADGCAEVVASAWCEAHGYARPIAYGRIEDAVTASIAAGTRASAAGTKPETVARGGIDRNAYLVTCSE